MPLYRFMFHICHSCHLHQRLAALVMHIMTFKNRTDKTGVSCAKITQLRKTQLKAFSQILSSKQKPLMIETWLFWHDYWDNEWMFRLLRNVEFGVKNSKLWWNIICSCWGGLIYTIIDDFHSAFERLMEIKESNLLQQQLDKVHKKNRVLMQQAPWWCLKMFIMCENNP